MANMLDYLDWRGDLTFQQAPFNEVDNLLLTELVYVNFTGIVPSSFNGAAVFLKEASRLFWEQHKEADILNKVSMTKQAAFVMRHMARTKRFENICLSAYVRDISNTQQSQFAAVCMALDDNSMFVSYSGTDDTLIGWREDFNMTYLNQTPGQVKSALYLNKVAQGENRPLRVGGHSKGGNLAVYACVFCEESIRKHIEKIYSNDGPGFSEDIIKLPRYHQLSSRIYRVVPKESIVGVLFNHGTDYRVVCSSESRARQHDMLSWEVMGNSMVYEEALSEQSRAIGETLNNWIYGMELPQRQQFIETVFSMLERAKVKTVDDLYHLKWKQVSEILRSQRELEEEEREILSNTWRMLIGASNETLRKTFQDKKWET